MVTLRPARPDDREWLLDLARHPDVNGSLMPRADEALESALERVFAGTDDEEVLVIEEGEHRVGVVRWQIRSRHSRIAGIFGLVVDRAARGQGFGLAAVERVTADLFARDFHRVEAEAYGFNAASIRTFERAGFTREGTRRRAYQRHGDWQDGVLLARLAED
jgi:RimJ/RimL family protein N-acetyltransferase